MNFFTRQGRALLIAAAVVVVGLAGCVVDPEESSGSNKCTSAENCRQVTIGSQTWMAENLNIKTSGSWCYDDSSKNCGKYGRLYSWEAAMTACPAGWHLPTREEWDILAEFVGGEKIPFRNVWGYAGEALKSKSGWDIGNGTDNYGFSALPGGYRSNGGGYNRIRYEGDWWTATNGDYGNAYNKIMSWLDAKLEEDDNAPNVSGLSVRCVAD